MRGTIAKHINELVQNNEIYVPENDRPKDPASLSGTDIQENLLKEMKLRRKKKQYWNKLNWLERSRRTRELRRSINV